MGSLEYILGAKQRKERNQQVVVLLSLLPKHLKTQAVGASSKKKQVAVQENDKDVEFGGCGIQRRGHD